MGVHGIDGPSLHVQAAASSPEYAPAPPRGVESPEAPAARNDSTQRTSEEQTRRARSNMERPPYVSARYPRLKVDDKTAQIVAQIVDSDGNVIKQIPPEEMLELAARLEGLRGLLFDQRA